MAQSRTNACSDGAAAEANHIGILDGLRGAMAYWVFYGHLKLACVGETPRLGHPANAVEVFMFLSGFLMAYHWVARETKFNCFKRQTFDFYLRRFFRIAPLYYLLFSIAFFGQHFFLPGGNNPATISVATSAANGYVDPSNHARTLFNALAHYTFVFGAFPQYVANNALPDWSIGLEMQFYLCFPFLLLAAKRFGAMSTIIVAIVLTHITNGLFSLYDAPAKLCGNFPQPGFLLFRLDIFLAGVCLAFHYRERLNPKGIYWLLLSCICLYSAPLIVKAIIFGTLCLMHFDFGKRDLAHRLLTGRLGRFAGDTSYSVYLLHTLILYPVLRSLGTVGWFASLPKLAKVGILLFIVTPPLYYMAYLLHRFVEQPGIAVGRKIARKLDSKIIAPGMVGSPPTSAKMPEPSGTNW